MMTDEATELVGKLADNLQIAEDSIAYYDGLTKEEQGLVLHTWIGRKTSFQSECRQLRKDLEPLARMMHRHPLVVRSFMGGRTMTSFEECYLRDKEPE